MHDPSHTSVHTFSHMDWTSSLLQLTTIVYNHEARVETPIDRTTVPGAIWTAALRAKAQGLPAGVLSTYAAHCAVLDRYSLGALLQ